MRRKRAGHREWVVWEEWADHFEIEVVVGRIVRRLIFNVKNFNFFNNIDRRTFVFEHDCCNFIIAVHGSIK